MAILSVGTGLSFKGSEPSACEDLPAAQGSGVKSEWGGAIIPEWWRDQPGIGSLRLEKTAHAAEQDREDIAAAREAWFDAQPALDLTKLVFIDETGASTKMACMRGRAPRGERLRASVPHGHVWTPTSVQDESQVKSARRRGHPPHQFTTRS